MPHLSIERPESPPQRIRVDHPCTLGPGEEVETPALAAVLRVTPVPDGLVLESTARMSVGARWIEAGTARLLRPGEQATMADAVLRTIADPPPEGTRELAAAILAGLDPTPVPGPSVLVVEGREAGRRFPVSDSTLVGRGADVDVTLADPLVSRRHLRLNRIGAAVLAHDVASKNGVLVNGRRPRGRRVTLRAGDELLVGGALLVLEDASATDPAPRREREDAPPPRRRELLAVSFASIALLAAALLLAQAAR
jgi:pSer/pThr/pTyr-binding forkhead associated (FHA) protein